MRALIEDRFPEHGIVGEEFGRARDDAEFVWVLDPIDGTKSFISGVPLFGTLIALTRAGARSSASSTSRSRASAGWALRDVLRA